MTDTDPTRILVVEDEAHLAKGLKLNFELEGMKASTAGTAREAGQLLLEKTFDAIVLDVMLPDVNGFELCRRLRESGNFTPVIMLTVRASGDDRVKGLESGADDYLPKPFEFAELVARVRSMLRRRRWDIEEPAEESNVLRFGNVMVDFDSHESTVDDEPVKLTRLELDLLRYMSERPGKVLSREELLEHVWKLANYPNTRTVDNFIMRLRKHFEPDPRKPRYFISVRGAGYKLVPEGE